MSEQLPKDYNGLLAEYNKLKSEFDEQNNVYEDYISSLETAKKELENKVTNAQKEVELYKKEVSKLKEANQDRNKDIDYLEKQLEKEQDQHNILKDKQVKTEGKYVELELENSNYFNKIRELECWGEELRQKLEAALEENIILHSEMEEFKQECDEKIQRIQEELEENKNEVLCKEKLIDKLTNHRDFLLKTAVKEGEDLKNSILNKSQRGLSGVSSSTLHKDKESNKGSSKVNKDIIEKESLENHSKVGINDKASERSGISKQGGKISTNLIKKNSDNRPTTSIVNKVPDKFLSQLGNSFINYSLDKHKDKDVEEDGEDEERDYFMQRIQNEVRSILENRKNFLLATLNYENFSFDILNVESNSRLGKIKAAVQVNEAIDEVLQKLKERKEKVILQKRLLKAKFDKLGIKV